jgi:predicted permease
MRTFFQDLRFGIRLLLASPGFTALAVLTLALGIAATTTVYTWMDALVLHPFAGVREDNRLAVLENVVQKGKAADPSISFEDFRAYRDHLKLISGLVVLQSVPASIGEGESAQRVWGELVSGNYFAVLGVKPVLGRVFAPEEYSDKPGAFAAVISHRLWRNRFHSDPRVLGATLRINRQRVTIVGVAPPEFHGIEPGLAFDLWVPLVLRSEGDRYRRQYGAFARLKPGVSVAQAHAEVAALAGQLARLYPKTNENRSARLVPVWKAHNYASSLLVGPLEILAAAGALVLLIACANVANLLLARANARRKEFGIRVALGAGAGRLARQLLTESLALAVLATIAGLLLVEWMTTSLGWFLPPTSLPVWLETPLNGRVFVFAGLVCLATAVAAGLPPVLQSLRPNLNEVLKHGGRSDAAAAESHRIGGLLVIAEVSLAVVSLIGAGLFLRSFQKLRSMSPGFEPANVLVSRLYLTTVDYTAEQEKQFSRRLRERLAAAPGVVAAAYGDMLPLGFDRPGWDRLEVEGYAPGRGENMIVDRVTVGPGYFDLLRIPLLAGRDFTAADREKTPLVMIVNESFARRFYPGRNPIGRRVNTEGPLRTIVGVVRDSKFVRLDEAPRPFFFLPFEQAHGGSGNQGIAFLVRTSGDPRGAVRLLRREVAALDPQAGGFEAMPLEESIGASWFGLRLATSLLGALGAIAVTLAAVGLYGVISYAVSRRTQEIGIRMALGAEPGDVVASVVRQGMLLTLPGLAIGIAATLIAARLVAHMLVEVSAADPLSFAAAALFLTAVALLASYLPARRATRVDPMRALRE